jgi:phospholipase C
VRGYLTEGRYLVFEMNGYALTNRGFNTTKVSGTPATSRHESINQRWVIHMTSGSALNGGGGSGTFKITSAVDKSYIAQNASLTKASAGADIYTIQDLGNGKGYSLMAGSGQFLSIGSSGLIAEVSQPGGFQVFSVTYHS